MPGAIGVNLRVTGHSSQGGRKYMEDFFSVAYQQSEDECDLEFAFFGIFDGHGGAEAAAYAKEHLMRQIVNQKAFWSDNDADVLRAIREGYIATHKAMWREQEKWPRTATGLPSTAGTTATVAFIRHGKMYIGHVGDSGIVLGYEDPLGSLDWKARPLTQDHKPECDIERSRIMSSGGKVVAKSGVSRVVWTRPKLGHKGPIRRSTPIDEIPFLAVARSLGDLWSYNSQCNEFVVSPEPDVLVIPIDRSFRCLVFGTDGLWNVLSPNAAVDIVRNAEYVNDRNYYCSKELLNPSRSLVNRALEKWSTTRVRADNTSVVTILLDPPGGPKRKQFASNTFNRHQVGHAQHHQQQQMGHFDQDWHTMEEACLSSDRMSAVAAGTSSSARNVEEELDLLNESLYNHTHQFNQMDMSGADFSLTANSSATAFGSSTHSNYENYMNLSASQQLHQQQHTSHQFQRAPPGGFLQSHLQGTPQMLQAMAMPFANDSSDYDQNDLETVGGGAPPPPADVMEHSHLNTYVTTAPAQHPHEEPVVHQNTILPTFSNLIEDTSSSYSLTRLETRMEQLTSSAASTSMYAHYQQLIETSSNYTPQIDLNTINTFHDYAGIPQHLQQNEVPGTSSQSPAEAAAGTSYEPQMSYAMDHEKFEWSQEWQQQQVIPQMLSGTATPQEPAAMETTAAPELDAFCDVEIPSSTLDTNCSEEVSASGVCERLSSDPVDVVAAPEVTERGDITEMPLSPTIQINEITSSGVVPTPPPQQSIAPLSMEECIEQPKKMVEKVLQPKVVVEEKVKQPVAVKSQAAVPLLNSPPANLRRRLRCQVSSSSSPTAVASTSSRRVEKENKSEQSSSASPTAKCNKRLRLIEAAPTTTTPTLAVTTRSSAVTTTRRPTTACVSTRKSAAAAALLKSATGNIKQLRNSSGGGSASVVTMKTALRSKQPTPVLSNLKATKSTAPSSSEKLISTTTTTVKRNLLLNSSKFNRQEVVAVQKEVIKKATELVGSSSTGSCISSSGIGRRLSKRDKVRSNSKVVASSSVATATSWRKSTVQTRNRVQKR